MSAALPKGRRNQATGRKYWYKRRQKPSKAKCKPCNSLISCQNTWMAPPFWHCCLQHSSLLSAWFHSLSLAETSQLWHIQHHGVTRETQASRPHLHEMVSQGRQEGTLLPHAWPQELSGMSRTCDLLHPVRCTTLPVYPGGECSNLSLDNFHSFFFNDLFILCL